MRTYVGIITRRGLELLFPESDYVRRCLARLAYTDRPAQRICCWAAMPDPVASEIHGQLNQGETDSALQILQASARFLGPVLPSDVRTRSHT